MLTRVPRGLRLMAAGALAFSVMSALAKLVGARIPLFELVFGRSLVVALLAGTALLRQGESLRPREPGLLLVRSLLGFAALSCYFYAIVHLPLADATVIFFTNPVLTALTAALVLHERMGLREVVLVMVSLSGVVVIARPSFLFGVESPLDHFAVAMCLTAAIFSAGAYVTIRRIEHDPPLRIVFYFATVTVMLSGPLIFLDPAAPSWLDVLAVVGVGVATHVGQLFVTWGFRLERAGRASAIGYLQIVFAAGWGWLLFAEVPDAWTWVGAVIIVGSTLVLMRVRPLQP